MINRMAWCTSAFILVLLFSCTSNTEPADIGLKKASESIISNSEKAGWETEWETVQKAARKEGIVTLYTPSSPELRIAISEPMKEYGITVEIISGRGAEVAEKILRERRAGIYNADLYGPVGLDTFVNIMKPAGALVPLEPLLILPEIKDPRMWYKGELPFADRERK